LTLPISADLVAHEGPNVDFPRDVRSVGMLFLTFEGRFRAIPALIGCCEAFGVSRTRDPDVRSKNSRK